MRAQHRHTHLCPRARCTKTSGAFAPAGPAVGFICRSSCSTLSERWSGDRVLSSSSTSSRRGDACREVDDAKDEGDFPQGWGAGLLSTLRFSQGTPKSSDVLRYCRARSQRRCLSSGRETLHSDPHTRSSLRVLQFAVWEAFVNVPDEWSNSMPCIQANLCTSCYCFYFISFPALGNLYLYKQEARLHDD